jgi:hypothetical protein
MQSKNYLLLKSKSVAEKKQGDVALLNRLKLGNYNTLVISY